MKSNLQSGNVFFLILAAVAMFAALAWVFTQNSRQSASSLTNEQSRIAAQEIVAYGILLADTVQKLKLRGCTETQFNFANTIWVRGDGSTQISAGHNPSAAVGCAVFASGEGNATAQILPISYTTGNAPVTPSSTGLGSGRILRLSITGVGDAARDELLYSTYRLSDAVCVKINDLLGITNPSNNPPLFDWAAPTDYSGTFGNVTMTDTSGLLSGKTAFCATNVSLNITVFVQVLLAR